MGRTKKLEGKTEEVINKYKELESLKETANYFKVKDTRTIKNILIENNIEIKKGHWNKKHGLYKHPLYNCWSSIKQRCYNPLASSYKSYGARGINMYKPWLDNPEAFINYVLKNIGPRPKNKTIDRINNNSNYEPGNIRWATDEEQAQNKRTTILDKSIIKQLKDAHMSKRLPGATSVRQLAKQYGIDYSYAKKISRGESWKNVV